MRHILTYLKPYRVRIAIGLSIKMLGTLAELLLPVLLTAILNEAIEALDIGRVILLGSLMIGCAAVACAGNIIANRMAARTSMEFSRAVRRELFHTTLYLSAHDADAFTVPSLESRITTDTYNVHNFVSMVQRMGVRAPILFVGGMAISFALDAHLALVMLVTLPFIFLIVLTISRKSVPMYRQVQTSVDRMVRVVREDAMGIRVIKALSKNEFENRRYDGTNRALCADERRAGTVTGIINPVMTLLMNLGITAVIAVSAVRVAEDSSSAATVIAFVQYFTLISNAMLALSRMFVMYTRSSASARRISEVLLTPEGRSIEQRSTPDAQAYVAMSHVTFSYLGKQPDVSDVTFALPRGGTLGVIGATGSGKTTLVRLLLRMYDADEGCVTLGGRAIHTYTRDELSAMFGVAQQNDFLYADTIEENIRFGRDLTHEQVEWAAKVAQAHDFILATESGYEHQLTPKGTNLSGGQKQRLLIARAIAARPQILILDDSSSALDYKTDAALRRALTEQMADSTVITVAQRVSSVKHCDVILVLDRGRVIGRGRHEELLVSCPEYREIADSQMGGAFVE